jgi:hypothetical protein
MPVSFDAETDIAKMQTLREWNPFSSAFKGKPRPT